MDLACLTHQISLYLLNYSDGQNRQTLSKILLSSLQTGSFLSSNFLEFSEYHMVILLHILVTVPQRAVFSCLVSSYLS